MLTFYEINQIENGSPGDFPNSFTIFLSCKQKFCGTPAFLTL